MSLLSIKVSKKVETMVRLEESTANLVDKYAHFVGVQTADEVVNSALEYIFTKDRAFVQYLEENPNAKVPHVLRMKKAPATSADRQTRARRTTVPLSPARSEA